MKKEKDIIIIDADDDIYPDNLRCIDKPPEKLYMIGNVEIMNERAISIVGSRKCTEYGKQTAMKIGEESALNNFAVISGMAMGIDNFAHQGALRQNGFTIACVAGGPDICYPKSHRTLYERIKREGLVVSEYPPGTEPRVYMFPQRNRIIAGLGEGVVVVEAGTNSGSLITAEYACQMGKTVFSVPGNINSPYSLGTNKLISDGAQAVALIDDIFYTLGKVPHPKIKEMEQMGNDEKRIYEFVRERGECSLDMICMNLNIEPILCSSIISIMEIKGLIMFSMGKVFVSEY